MGFPMELAARTTGPATGQGVLRRMRDGIAAFAAAWFEALSRRPEVEALNALSDAELARMGLTREGIARHVYRDRFLI
jgi:uncharacterized protein YjiS (DUF1127 family)